MRRLAQLIHDVRFNSDNEKTSRYTDIRMMKLFSDAQRELQALIVTSDTLGKWFITQANQVIVYGQSDYDLPADMFSVSYLLGVGHSGYSQLPLLAEKDFGEEIGYALAGNKLRLSPLPTSGQLGIRYVKALPTLSIRIGQISAINPGVSVTLSGQTLEDITKYDDFVCFIDRDGAQKAVGKRIASYNSGTGVLTLDSTVGAVVGDYVVIGKNASDTPQLPDVCEAILTIMVEKALQRIDASTEFDWAQLITNEQRAAIAAVVEGAQHDAVSPPITDRDYM